MADRLEDIRVPKLRDQSNWALWKVQIEASLETYDHDGVLDGSVAAPEPLPKEANEEKKKAFEAEKLKFKKANGYAKKLILSSVENGPLQLISDIKNAKEMWDKLVNTYERRSEQRLHYLYRQLSKFTYTEGDTVAVHVAKAQKLYREINEESQRVEKIPASKILVMVHTLSSLPREYRFFESIWDSVPEEQRTFKYLEERLTILEDRLKNEKEVEAALVSNKQAVSEKAFTQEVAAPAATGVKSRCCHSCPHGRHAGSSLKRDYSKFKCHACGKLGHIKSECRERATSAAKVATTTGRDGEQSNEKS